MTIAQEKGESPAAWREFAAGMEFLRRYGIHNTANAGAIRRDNLRLLHRVLLQDDDYRQRITSARREAPALSRPHWSTLTASRQLHAHLVSMPANSSIRLTTQAGYLGMFLILSGSAETISRTDTPSRRPRHSWWPHGWLSSKRTQIRAHHLKANDVVCVNHNAADTGLLVSGKKGGIILAVFTAQQGQPPSPATPRSRPPTQQPPLHSAI